MKVEGIKPLGDVENTRLEIRYQQFYDNIVKHNIPTL